MSKKSRENNEGDGLPYDTFVTMRTAIIAVSIIAVLLLLSTLFFAGVSAKLYVKKEKVPEPIIFQVHEQSKMVVQIERGDLAVNKQSLLRSRTFRDYVFNRETINHIDEATRWGNVKIMSSDDVWRSFATVVDPNVNKDSPLANLDFTRKIEIITDYPMPNTADNYRVEFLITDTVNNKPYPAKRYVAIIQFDDSDAQILYKDRFVNIDGIEITAYEIYPA